MNMLCFVFVWFHGLSQISIPEYMLYESNNPIFLGYSPNPYVSVITTSMFSAFSYEEDGQQK